MLSYKIIFFHFFSYLLQAYSRVYNTFNALNVLEYKCITEKPKIEELCAIYHYNEVHSVKFASIYIFEKSCSNGFCIQYLSTPLYTCQDKVVPLDYGEDCEIDEDCKSNYCIKTKGTGTCGIKEDGEKCEENQCGAASYCGYNSTESKENDNKLCHPKAKEDENCQFKTCVFGTICNHTLNSTTKEKEKAVCKKWGSIEDGDYATDAKLCKSGTFNFDGVCDTLETYQMDNKTIGEGTYYYKFNFYTKWNISGEKLYSFIYKPSEIDYSESINSKLIKRTHNSQNEIFDKYAFYIRKTAYWKTFLDKIGSNNYVNYSSMEEDLRARYSIYQSYEDLFFNDVMDEKTNKVKESHACLKKLSFDFFTASVKLNINLFILNMLIFLII